MIPADLYSQGLSEALSHPHKVLAANAGRMLAARQALRLTGGPASREWPNRYPVALHRRRWSGDTPVTRVETR